MGGKRLDPALKQRFLERLDAVGSVSPVARELGLNLNTAFTLARKAGMTTGHLGHPRREEYKQLRARGVSRREAAQQVGVNPRTAKDWDNGVHKSRNGRLYPDGRRVNYTTGTVTMSGVINKAPVSLKALEKKLHPRFLSLSDRERIRDLHAAGQSLRAIGRALGRPASTISRELRNNSGTSGYHPYAAHRAAASRRPRPKERKLLREGPLRNFVRDGLRKRWSPE
ncbi:hypothetical protein GCM10010279_69530 [Streptomyces mutabilis]|nr:hypothetical protein GCM10010279_69530 [Streptomyces mutabilis]